MKFGCLAAGALFLLLVGGCVGWNETGIRRAERRVRRIARPGMTEREVAAAMERAGIDYSPRLPEGAAYGCIGDAQCIYIGTASLHFSVWYDAESKVRDVTFTVTTSCL